MKPARHRFALGRQRLSGVSLIEALVALTVMSFGMLAVVGVQATLRQNSDVAKQRSEAVRIGQEAMESWRAYSQLEEGPAGVPQAYNSIKKDAAGRVVSDYKTNTNYTLVRNVLEVGDPGYDPNRRTVQITVSWADRNGKVYEVKLDSHIARSDPALTAAVLNAPAVPGGAQIRPLGRHAGIPLTAKDMGGGLSAFKPPAEGGGTTALVFNNLSGLIVGICTVSAGTTTAALSASDIASCKDNTLAHSLSGYVRFSGPTQPTATDAENPSGRARNLDIQLTITDGRTPLCFDDAPTTSTAAATQTFVSYFCVIPANASRSWAGFSTIAPLPFADQADSSWSVPGLSPASEASASHRLCRYTPATSDAQVVPNAQHPQVYRIEYADPARQLQPLPMPPLVNQNFLVTLIEHACPTDVAADPTRGDFINSNTLAHKPVS